MQILGWFLGLDGLTAIEHFDVSLAAGWAQDRTFWVVVGCAAALLLALFFYARYQSRGSAAWRTGLAICRGVLLVLLLLTLAEPVLRITRTSTPPPLVYLVIDGTESMEIEDDWSPAQRAELARAVGRPEIAAGSGGLSRTALVRALLAREENNPLTRLEKEKNCRVEAFLFDGQHTSQLRRLTARDGGDGRIDPPRLAEQVAATGQVTALGAVLDELAQQYRTGTLAGVVLVSDFAHNAGVAPVGRQSGDEQSPAARLGVPLYTVGVGAVSAIDLAVELRPPPRMKKAERSTIEVELTQQGLADQSVTVTVLARRLEGEAGAAAGPREKTVGERTVTLDAARHLIELPFTPDEAGRFEFIAEAAPLPGETITENNRSSREVNIVDDYLRLMYVEYEPTWEWRFVKEVFHRDKLVGLRGFRTFLRSADPKVRQTNELFLPTLTPARSEFFATDVIFLGDMPASALSQRFCEMTKEFVSEFGGGLVVIAGPRFGPGQLAGTPLADMLPVRVDPSGRPREDREFRLRLTPHGLSTDFMQLGAAQNDAENLKAWENLGPLPWYQPVLGVHSQATVLAEHPTDTCADGRTPQPLIAVRKYGAAGGEVVYVGFNETWRLRRKYGELYYRQLWSQMISRLALSHALGSQKRFVVRTDRQRYQVEDRVVVRVEAYDANFERLSDEKLPDRRLAAELTLPPRVGEPTQTRAIAVSAVRDGVFEARIPVFQAGEYHLRVRDPITDKFSEVRFQVTELSAERRNPVRNLALQQQLAQATGGAAYELEEIDRFVDEVQLAAAAETVTRVQALWATPLWFSLVVGLMLGEWFFRKMVNLP